ncbi:MAG: hypothetical protein ACXVAY_01350 [Mucilaginibacter sp.]
MKDWKTTLAGVLAGAPVAIDALLTAYSQGAFNGKSGMQLAAGVGIVLLGVYAPDKNAKAATSQQ